MICLQRLAQSGTGNHSCDLELADSPPHAVCAFHLLTRVISFKSGEVGIGIKNRGNGGEFSKLFIFLPSLQTTLVVGQAITLCLIGGGRGGWGYWGRRSGPGTLLTPVWTEEPPSFPGQKNEAEKCMNF